MSRSITVLRKYSSLSSNLCSLEDVPQHVLDVPRLSVALGERIEGQRTVEIETRIQNRSHV